MNPRRSIGYATARVVAAENAVLKALAKHFPIGAKVRFYIMHGQVTPSRGEVIGYEGGRHAYLRVRLESRKREVRSVPANKAW